MSVFIAARTLGHESGWTLSPLEMQKTLYVAQLFHVGRTQEALFPETFEAWDFGPVVPPLYHKLKPFKNGAVQDIFDAPLLARETLEYLSVCEALALTRHLSPGELVSYTHRPGGAWERHFKAAARGVKIPLSDIFKEWRETVRPSDEALAWAEQMAQENEASPARYIQGERERAFRARVLGEYIH